MKNIFSKNVANQTKEFVNQKDIKLEYDQNQYSTVKQKQNIKSTPKLIKGKVKVYNSRPNHYNSENLDEESELNLISERMLLFVKFTFLFLLIITFVLLLKKNA